MAAPFADFQLLLFTQAQHPDHKIIKRIQYISITTTNANSMWRVLICSFEIGFIPWMKQQWFIARCEKYVYCRKDGKDGQVHHWYEQSLHAHCNAGRHCAHPYATRQWCGCRVQFLLLDCITMIDCWGSQSHSKLCIRLIGASVSVVDNATAFGRRLPSC